MKARSTPIPAEQLLAEAGFLHRLARGLAIDAHAADDLVQDTLVAALENPPRKTGPIRGWLATIAANLARNRRRDKERREQREHDAARAEPGAGDEIAHERIELQRLLFELVLTLPAEQRTVLYLRYYEDRTPSAIAEHLAVPLKTVKSRHTRAIAALRDKLDARSGGDRGAWMEALVPLVALRAPPVGAGAVPLTIGGIVMKKAVLFGSAALLLALAWFVFAREEPLVRVAADDRSAPVELARPAKPVQAPLTEASTAAREPVIPPASAATGALEVHLHWSDGKSAADVGLDILCAADPAPRNESFRGFTDAQGIARFPALFAGKVTLVPDMRERFEADVEPGATLTIDHTFTGGTDVRGRVLDPKGASVGSASIWCKGADMRTTDTIRAAACAPDGSFQLRDVSERAEFGARAAGFRASNGVTVSDITIGPSGAREVDLHLGASGGRLRGLVLDPDGKPLDHAIVVAGPLGGGMTGGMVGSFPRPGTVETDHEGRFEIVEDLEPGKQPIHATARGYPVWSGEVAVVAGTTGFVEVRLEVPARVEGRVLDFDGKPIAGVTVIASKEDRGGWHHDALPASSAVSDEQGGFALEWIRSGACEIHASDYSRPEIGRGRAEIVCTAGQTTNCDVRLERGNTISGRVQDRNGAPLAGWTVNSSSTSWENQWYPRRAKTAGDGSFELLNVGEGEHDLLVRGPVFQVAGRATANRIPAGAKDVVLVVADANAKNGIVRARVVDPSGKSIADVVTTLLRTGQNGGAFLEPDAATGVVETQVLPGRYRLQLSRARHNVFVGPEFLVEEGKVTDAGDLLVGALGRVEVRVDGLPKELQRIQLSLEGPDRGVSGNLEWKDGVWCSEEVAAGRWFVTWHEAGILLRDADIMVPAGETAHVRLVAEPAVRVQITFEDPGSRNVTIETRDGQGKTLAFQRVGFDGTGSEVRHYVALPSGQASIEVHTREGLSGRVDLDVNASLSTPVKIPLR